MLFVRLGFLVLLLSSLPAVWAAPVEEYSGIVVDDVSAELVGDWSKSKNTPSFVGEGYIFSPPVEGAKVVFTLPLKAEGEYQVLVSYSAAGNRSETAMVRVFAADGAKEVKVNQQLQPTVGPFHKLGAFQFTGDKVVVEVTTEGTKKGVVIADAVRLLTNDQLTAAEKEKPQVAKVPPVKPVVPPTPAKPKEEVVPAEPAPAFVRAQPTKPLKKLTSAELDTILAKDTVEVHATELVDDGGFIRRLTLDLLGRQPTPAELKDFVADTAGNKRTTAVEKLLATPEFGQNWARYWSDVISYRTPQPELTFLNYGPLQDWMAEKFNAGLGWDQITYEMLTAAGKGGDNPAASFIGFHQADKSRLAAETTRVFLSTQIQCAECHDHKFIEMPQETFHHLAAFFVRVDAKLPWNDSNGIMVSSKPKGEHRIPGGKADIAPLAFGADKKVGLGDSDITRRAALAEWIVGPANPWYAKAFTNRVWARMMGRGFCEPVDEIGDLGDRVLPEVHVAVAEHFIAANHDFRSLVQLIAGTKMYQRAAHDPAADEKRPFATMVTTRLRGDEVFQSLTTALELPNVTPPAIKPSAEIRFPPPPKSTRDLVNEAFGYDPSLGKESVVRSMQQAMFLMNNRQVQKQIDASPGNDTILAKLLEAEQDNTTAIKQLYAKVLAREPNARELEISQRHLQKVGERKTGFEDLLWSLLNSAEFTSRR